MRRSVRMLSVLARVAASGMAVVVGALALTSTASAYWAPPLQAVTAWVEHSGGRSRAVFEVYDPGTGHVESGGSSLCVGIYDLVVASGVVAWVEWNGTQLSVACAVYEPQPGHQHWHYGGSYLCQGISNLTTADGVVAWEEWNGTQSSVTCAVYDPQPGHQHWHDGGSWLCQGIFNLTTADGVVAWAEWNGTASAAAYAVYDPRPGHQHWHDGGSGWYSSITDLAVANATVTYRANSSARTAGYDPSRSAWYSGTTKPLAWFYAAPTSGNPPLWVWFFDLSIGANSWAWNFGDGGASGVRSPYHVYGSVGVFTVSQFVSGPAGSSTATGTIRTDFMAPSGTVLINDGVAYTTSTSVTLTLAATDNSGSVASMRFSNDGASWSGWQPYWTSASWTLSSGDGDKIVYAQFQDAASNVSSPCSDTILLDTTLPQVVSTDPANGAAHVPADASVIAYFTEPMDPATISGATVSLVGAAHGAVIGLVSYDANYWAAVLDPTSNLTPDAYTARIVAGTYGVKDSQGLALPSDYVWTFTVSPPHSLTVSAWADPLSLPSGGMTQCSASASDGYGHAIASWSWSDNGAGGTFLPSHYVQNPAWTAPGNPGDTPISRRLTVTATCAGFPALTESAEVLVTEEASLYQLTVECDPPEGGSVSGAGSYEPGETVTLTATPAAGCLFVSWSGDLVGSENPATLVMDASKHVIAHFRSAWFEDDDPAISYTGSWTAVTNPKASDGHATTSVQTNAAASVAFTGTGIEWCVGKGPQMGKARVSLDGGAPLLVDLYSRTLKLVTLPKTGLAAGPHTLRIEVSGQKNPASRGYMVNIDALGVVP